MKVTADNEQRLINYLLGNIDEAEQEQIEAGYFADPEHFQQLMVVEDELIDAYVRRRLSEAEMRQFESFFLRSAERRERVEFAQAWLRFLEKKSQANKSTAVQPAETVATITPIPTSSHRSTSSHYAWLATAAAVVLMLVGGSWLISEMARLKGQLREIEQARERLTQQQTTLQQQLGEQQTRNEQLAQELQAARNNPQNPDHNPDVSKPTALLPTIATFILKPSILRSSGQGNKLLLPANTEWVKLQATISEGPYSRYRVIITNDVGEEVWHQNGLKDQSKGIAKTIIIKLPADILTDNDLILTISGIEANGEATALADYPFTVTKR